MTKVHAPNRAYNGISAGVRFTNGEADTEDPRALQYFRRAGYGVGEPPSRSVDAADAIYPQSTEPVTIGTPLRDAAVEPRDSDFLAPTNAGQADPHGPLVVAPGLHAVPPAPIRPGPVAIDDPARQDAEETELAQQVLVDHVPATVATGAETNAGAGPDATAAKVPGARATKAEWIDFAVDRGMSRDDAEELTKAQLAERFGG